MSSVEKREENGKIVVNIIGKQYLWFIEYLDGYYKSTRVLLDNLNLQNKTLIYPTLFSFSQYLELWIKLLLLAVNDSNNVKELKINNHSIPDIIKNAASKNKDLLKLYGVNIDSLYQIADRYSYFIDFTCEYKKLSMVARFPINNCTPNIIVNFDKIDKAQENDYQELKNNILETLRITSDVTEVFFYKYFKRILEEIL